MRTALEIYFGINLFLAGYCYAKDVRWATDRAEMLVAWLSFVGLFLFGAVFFPLLFILVTLKWVFDKIDGVFQLRFFWMFYFTKEYYNMEENQLALVNRISVNKRNGNSIKDRIYRYGTKLMNKRNNFDPSRAIGDE